MSKFKETVKDFAENTTAHGVGRVATSNAVWLRALWGIIFLGTFAVCIYQIYVLLVLYFQYPVTIQRSVVFDEVEFPAVSFCNLNPVRRNQIGLAESVNLTQLVRDFDQSTIDQLTGASSSRKKRDTYYGLKNEFNHNIRQAAAKYLPVAQEINSKNNIHHNNLPDTFLRSHNRRTRRSITSENCPNGAHNLHFEILEETFYCIFLLNDYVPTGTGEPFVAANAACEAEDSNAYLARINNAERMQFVSQNVTTGCSRCTWYAWLGLQSDATGTELTWVHDDATWGDNESYVTWEPAEPGVVGNECLQIHLDNFQFRMHNCSANALPLCEVQVDFGANVREVTTGDQSDTESQGTTVNQGTTENQNPEDGQDTTQDPPDDNESATEASSEEAESSSSGGYDPIDDIYVPLTSLEDLPWFDNTDGEVSSEVQNSQELTEALYNVDIQTRRMMGHQLQDLMQECTWNGIVCTPLNITGFMSRRYGNCFTFNSAAFTKKLFQTRPGQSYGLSMTLFIDQAEYIFSVTPSAGVRMLIHDHNKHPFMEDDGFNINTGQRTAVKLQKIIYKRLGDPFGNCTKGKGYDLNYDAEYSVTSCLKSCYQNKIIKNCDCADSTLAVPDATSICETSREVSCMNGIHSDIENGKRKCKCPELCDDVQHRQSVSASEWPGDALIDILTLSYQNRSDALDVALQQPSGLSRNLLKVDVYFEELKYDLVEELEAYSLSKLLGDMGGQLGLWIGVSVLTLIEFIQFLVELSTHCCKKKDGRVSSVENVKKEKTKLAFEINSSERKVPPSDDNSVSVSAQA